MSKLKNNVAIPSLAHRLRAFRKSHRWTREMAAEFLDVKPRTLEQWEQGKRKPQGLSLKVIEKRICV